MGTVVTAVEVGVGALSVMLNREEPKTASLLSPLSTTLKSLMSPLLKTTNSLQKHSICKSGTVPTSPCSAWGGGGHGLVMASGSNKTLWTSPALYCSACTTAYLSLKNAHTAPQQGCQVLLRLSEKAMKHCTETVSQPLQGLCAPLPAGRCLWLGSI